MPRPTDHLPADPDLLADLQRSGGLSIEALRASAAWVSRPPSPRTWRRILDPLALLLGISLIVAAVVYLVGFNWEGLGRLSRVAVGGAAVLATGGAALAVGTERLAGKALATAAIPILMAALSAVALAYPTDGEPWVLLAIWTGLSVPWAIAGRNAVGWVFLVISADITLGAVLGTFLPGDGPWALDLTLLSYVGLHTVAWAAFGAATLAGLRGADTWARHLLLAPVLALLTVWPVQAVFAVLAGVDDLATPLVFVGAPAWLVVGLVVQVGFGLGRFGPFPAAIQGLSTIVVVTSTLVAALVRVADAEAAFFATCPLSVVVLLQFVAVTAWLISGWRRQRAAALAAEDAATDATTAEDHGERG